jgi:hypothetical protein
VEILEIISRLQVSKDAIIPDILIHNYPSDTNGHGNAVIAAITDVKTVRVDKGQNKLPSRGTRRTVRRGIGCLGMKVAVEEKLQRIMLIRSNKQEANAAAHNKMPSPLIHQELKSISKK